MVATLAVGVSDALAGPSFPLPYALKSNWNSVSIASVVAAIAAITVLQLALVVALGRRRPVAPAIAETTSLPDAGDASASEQTRKAA